MDIIYSTKRNLVCAAGNELHFIGNNIPLQKPTLLIQPSLDLLLFIGESDEAWKMKSMFEAVQNPAETPHPDLIVVPLGLNTPYGFSAKQAEYTINRMTCDVLSNFVVRFYEHLCLDDDIREWIEMEMKKQAAA